MAYGHYSLRNSPGTWLVSHHYNIYNPTVFVVDRKSTESCYSFESENEQSSSSSNPNVLSDNDERDSDSSSSLMSPNHLGETRTPFLQFLDEANCQFSNVFYCFETTFVWQIVIVYVSGPRILGFTSKHKRIVKNLVWIGTSTKRLWLQNNSNPNVQNVPLLMTRQSNQMTIVTVKLLSRRNVLSS